MTKREQWFCRPSLVLKYLLASPASPPTPTPRTQLLTNSYHDKTSTKDRNRRIPQRLRPRASARCGIVVTIDAHLHRTRYRQQHRQCSNRTSATLLASVQHGVWSIYPGQPIGSHHSGLLLLFFFSLFFSSLVMHWSDWHSQKRKPP